MRAQGTLSLSTIVALKGSVLTYLVRLQIGSAWTKCVTILTKISGLIYSNNLNLLPYLLLPMFYVY